jgi:cbb3-type cytochrome oxidase subunit 3
MPPNPLPLKDIHLPEAISWWPPAIGWWLVVVLVLLLLAFGYWLYKRLTKKTAIKTASSLLTELKLNTSQDGLQKLQQLSTLMRRVAISIMPRQDVASLTGQKWMAFLDQKLDGKPFQSGIGQLLAQAPYRQQSPSDAEILQLISLCEDWLKHCLKRKP